MSLVEKALNKIKEAERQSAGRAAQLAAAAASPPPQPAAAAAVDDVMPPSAAAAVVHAAPMSEPRPAPFVEIARAAPPRRQLKIDPDSLRAAGYMPPQQQEHEMVEQYRHIKRPLIGRALERGARGPGRPMNVIMVTSALPQEGKTFTAINLTRSFALEKDASILLIDADVANPQTTHVLGASGCAGLVDALSDPQMDVESLVLDTNVPGLQVLPVGSPTDSAVELLGSQRMVDLVDRLLQAVPNRIVLIDSAPLLITNEGKALIPMAGQVVLVVRANATPQHAVVEAADLFSEEQFVGVVLNQCEEAVGLGYGYYGGTYNYGGSYGYGSYGRKIDGTTKTG